MSKNDQQQMQEWIERYFREVEEGREDFSYTREAVARHAARLLESCSIEGAVHEGLSKGTVKFYTERGIVSEGEGTTRNVTYTSRHVMETAFARLSGHMRWVTLDEAAARVQGTTPDEVRALLADALLRYYQTRSAQMPERVAVKRGPVPSITYSLGGGAFLVLPAAHEAFASGDLPSWLKEALESAIKQHMLRQEQEHREER